MGITGILACVVVVFMAITVGLIVSGIKQKKWKRVVATVVIFFAVLALMGYGFVSFITSM